MVTATQGTVAALLFVAVFGGDLYRAVAPSVASPPEVCAPALAVVTSPAFSPNPL